MKIDLKSTATNLVSDSSIFVRDNKYLPDGSCDDLFKKKGRSSIINTSSSYNDNDNSQQEGRQVRYVATTFFTPVYVSARQEEKGIGTTAMMLDQVYKLNDLLRAMFITVKKDEEEEKDTNLSSSQTDNDFLKDAAKVEQPAVAIKVEGGSSTMSQSNATLSSNHGKKRGITLDSKQALGRFETVAYSSKAKKIVPVIHSHRLDTNEE